MTNSYNKELQAAVMRKELKEQITRFYDDHNDIKIGYEFSRNNEYIQEQMTQIDLLYHIADSSISAGNLKRAGRYFVMLKFSIDKMLADLNS